MVAGVCFADMEHGVTCVDVDEEKLALMRAGVSPIYEEGLEELLVKNIATGRLFFTSDYKQRLLRRGRDLHRRRHAGTAGRQREPDLYRRGLPRDRPKRKPRLPRSGQIHRARRDER